MRDKVIVAIIAILIIIQFMSMFMINQDNNEHFADMPVEYNKNVYDNFYAKIYDELFYSEPKITYESNLIKKNIKKMDQVLDIGCGTGQHLSKLKKYNIIGLDNSDSMLQIAKEKSPKTRFIKGNFKNKELFGFQQFDTIMVMYFVIYYQKDITKLLDNCYKWLKRGGQLIIHLVNPEKFDPILEPASPFPAFSLQKYSKTRITKSNVVFNNFEYEGDFTIDLDTNQAKFTETFTFNDKDKPTKKQVHNLNIPPLDKMVNIIKNSGFVLKKREDLVVCGYEYQYLYFFTKN